MANVEIRVSSADAVVAEIANQTAWEEVSGGLAALHGRLGAASGLALENGERLGGDGVAGGIGDRDRPGLRLQRNGL